MPQSRWPIITTSISGIGTEIWKQFKATADARGVSDREAAEEAICELAGSVERGEAVVWEPVKAGPPHSVRAHEAVWAEVQAMVGKTGYRQNVVILTAFKRWIAKA